MKSESPEVIFHRAATEAAAMMGRDRADIFEGLFSGLDLISVLDGITDMLKNVVDEGERSELMIPKLHAVIEGNPGLKTTTELGKVAASYVENIASSHSSISGDYSCPVAEARFLQSIYQLETPDAPRDGKARVYLDTSGHVLAYKKHRGDKRTLVLDSCEYIKGLIPGGIVNITATGRTFEADVLHKALPETANPQIEVVTITEADTVYVNQLRPSVFTLSGQFRRSVEFDGIDEVDYRHCSFSEFGRLTATEECEEIKARVAQRVAEAIS